MDLNAARERLNRQRETIDRQLRELEARETQESLAFRNAVEREKELRLLEEQELERRTFNSLSFASFLNVAHFLLDFLG
jgi:hypothetical protein